MTSKDNVSNEIQLKTYECTENNEMPESFIISLHTVVSLKLNHTKKILELGLLFPYTEAIFEFDTQQYKDHYDESLYYLQSFTSSRFNGVSKFFPK
jgi:hypothetical protein